MDEMLLTTVIAFAQARSHVTGSAIATSRPSFTP